jgi:hypothetical protein
MFNILLMATLASPPANNITPRAPEFLPDRASVFVHDDGAIEIHGFDGDNLIGVMVVETNTERLRIAAGFGDGYVEGVLPNARIPYDPAPDLMSSDQLRQLCEPEDYDIGNFGDVTMWWGTDLHDPCAATMRVIVLLELAESELAEQESAMTIARSNEQAGPSRRECIVRFAAAGTVCGLVAIFGPGATLAGIACLKGVFDNWCVCNKYLPVKIC